MQDKWGTACLLRGTYCTGDGTQTVDHWVPLSKGGTDAIWNLRPACHQCNQEKSNMTPRQWEVWTGHKFGAARLPLPKPTGKYEFATLADLRKNLDNLRS